MISLPEELAAEWKERQRTALLVTPALGGLVWVTSVVAGLLSGTFVWGPFGLITLGLLCHFALSWAGRRGWITPALAVLLIGLIAVCVSAAALGYSGGALSPDAGLVPMILAVAAGLLSLRVGLAFVLQIFGGGVLAAAIVWGTSSGHDALVVTQLRIVIVCGVMGGIIAWAQDRYVQVSVERRHRVREETYRATMAEERQRIARDLHDHVGAHLTAIALHAERARRRLSAEATPTLGWIESAVHVCIEELRDTIWALSTDERDAAELLATLRRRAEDVATEAGLELRWEAEQNEWAGSVSSEVSVALSAILREALTNVVRHADASAVDISLSRQGAELTLSVCDNGRGLQGDKSGGRGLDNIRARASEGRGEARIENISKGGVRVFARLPLQPQAAAEQAEKGAS